MPMKPRSCLRVLGVLIAWIAWTFLAIGDIPVRVMLYPRYSIS